MLNWEAIHEGQDARDAERIKKRDQLLTKSTEMTHKLAASSNEIEVDIHHSITKLSKKAIQMKNVMMLLKNCNWFTAKIPYDTTTVQQNQMTINITPTQIKIWKDDIKQQESVISTR